MSTEAKKTVPFQTEVKELLNLMIHSLYSQKEIFLRELVSNASDAIDKLRVEAFTHKEWQVSDAERSILIIPDPAAHTLTIQDNGIGMSADEVVQNIGTIAHSGTREFLKASAQMKDKPELIGQFGVGFYSAFMVADRVTLHTQKAGETTGTVWESTGNGEYSIGTAPRTEGHGTTIVLHLKPVTEAKGEDESAQDFTEEWTLRGIIKKYSDFISVPVKMRVTRQVAKQTEDGTPSEEKTAQVTDETINSQKALWMRSASGIKPEEYSDFYRQVSHDWNEPLRTIHFRAEGTQEFSALMFIPKEAPYDYNHRDTKFGLSLYVRRVFIMSHCEDLQPHYLRFVKGIVDSSDLPLNVSREILQKDSQIQGIQKAIVSKILNSLKDLMKSSRGDYETFFENFGVSLKEGVVTDRAQKEKLSDLLLFKTNSAEGWTSLADYVARMKPEQKEIYFLSGDSAETLKNSPYLERLKSKDYEVILLTDSVDEWLTRELAEYKEKKLVSVTSEKLDLDTAEEKTAKQEDLKKAEEKLGDLKTFIQTTLNNQIKEVRYSDRLVDSPACLVSQGEDPSARMERILGSMGKNAPHTKRILEINPVHPVFEKIKNRGESQKAEWIEMLYNQALLNEGSPIENPAKFGQQIAKLMMEVSH